ncbi:hypothetical protein BU24DRAFT_214616 [Aaosphaeria arxii CBS 175.79]|uniref:Secreted protein n=1 Tax=Aaosphaeria arxii CBS 175.79 TaxID=1450172 RepID=A0A6A5XMI3_9PLEO|nr:uncharacterized protein BU24DRAFT_214616 [Aaosphaeria arxii CBS 175.79]KAF2014455.1 hypothetical protein BU24DRAFT_214616 [Aaosphaeria arxii CBS 175.79]
MGPRSRRNHAAAISFFLSHPSLFLSVGFLARAGLPTLFSPGELVGCWPRPFTIARHKPIPSSMDGHALCASRVLANDQTLRTAHLLPRLSSNRPFVAAVASPGVHMAEDGSALRPSSRKALRIWIFPSSEKP